MIKLVAPFSASGGSVVSVNGKMGVVVLTPEDIGALPNGALEGYATEQYINEQIENIDIPETDLTGYATEDYVQEKIAEAQLSGGGEDVDLSAYATKQYVSERVNAIELMPGPAGPQGPKGNDGYTPVKGVDYFDGAPGKDGKDGADGAPGKDGVDGKDYVLTDADKQEIAGMVEVTGGGGSVNIDNETIIEENGVIKTAVGGSMSMADKEQLYYWGNENGAEGDWENKIYFDTRMENLDETLTAVENGEIDMHCKIVIGQDALERECTIDSISRSSDKWRIIFDIPDCDFQSKLYVDFPFVSDYYAKTSMLYSFELYTPEAVVYTPIRNEFIDAEYFATREYVAELIGGIENGSY